ncbi:MULTISPECIES: HD family hydrolase [unclassified Mesorhizobium]|uniref:HD family hydrolase n=2 Tax=Mesorhizobium TaxID=68287 RepID=UPI000F751BA9|nr:MULTISPECIES: HD family hydrolase [unclassified Mesorhizobium]AZO70700.1 HD family hydrolase [Mesorhizobium sp. M1D.F.Ca.ET.043.01.1.1]RWA91813.1 MAG: HD family hydrolase [Mesorhizobium sp.]RWE17195.1 MAG: HD family hydrolase [Mesorhizobium sp.]RWE42126.1 MAG: HD family hydrolase [Mesorhizobium sp.]
MAADRAGAPPRAWQRMLSGRRLDLLDPSPLDIEIADIAHGLARVARWNGQTSGDHAFSVAQHSLLVEALYGDLVPTASAEARLAALLHDAPEYVIGDMISPFKSVMGGSYKDCELRLQRAIHLRFALPAELGATLRKDIKRADQIAAYYEATLLAGFSTAEATEYFGRPRGFSAERFDFTPRSVTWAQAAFLKRFATLEAKRQPLRAMNSTAQKTLT